MLIIKKTNIELTRGDSAYITLDIRDGEGNPLVLSPEDTVRCQVRTAAVTGALLFEGDIVIEDDVVMWHISPEDTASLNVGEYVWDAQLELSSGDIFTFIPVSTFEVLGEVTLPEGVTS